MGFPHVVFSLTETPSLEEFEEVGGRLLLLQQQCPLCVDNEFSAPILLTLAKMQSATLEVKLQIFREIQLLLQDLAIYTPVASDAVEVRHGQLQNVQENRFRGKRKERRHLKELSLLHSIVAEHSVNAHHIQQQTMPALKVSSGIKRRVGVQSVNQFSSENAKAGLGSS
jgi:hypothetical protein